MKKVLLFCALLLGSFASKAQQPLLHVSQGTQPPGTFEVIALGNNAPIADCSTPLSTNPYSVPNGVISIDAMTAAWTTSPGTQFSSVRLFYNSPIGLQYYDINLCAYCCGGNAIFFTWSLGSPGYVDLGAATGHYSININY